MLKNLRLTLLSIISFFFIAAFVFPKEIHAANAVTNDIIIRYHYGDDDATLYKTVIGSSSSGVGIENLPLTYVDPGKYFMGWIVNDNNTVDYPANNSGNRINEPGKYELYPSYGDVTYNITFNKGDSNIGDGVMSSIQVTHSDTEPIVLEERCGFTASDDRYVFVGWSPNNTYLHSSNLYIQNDSDITDKSLYRYGQTGSVKIKDFGERATDYNSERNIILYAQWVPKNQKIKFDANGGTFTGSGSTSPIVLNGTTPHQLYGDNDETRPTKAGYTFAGWTTQSSGKPTSFFYNGGDSVTLIYGSNTDSGLARYATGKDTVEITLYAIWQHNTLNYKYDNNQATTKTSDWLGTAKSISVGLSNTFMPSGNIGRKGYKFKGVRVYFKGTKYDSKNDPIFDIEEDMYFENDPFGNIIVNGTDISGSPAQISIGISKEDDDVVTFVADWDERVAKIEFDGANSASNVTGTMDPLYVSGSKTSNVTIPGNGFSREGYLFNWWSFSVNGTKAYDNNGKITPGDFTDNYVDTGIGEIKEIKFYPVWKSATYNIRFNSNAGSDNVTGVMPDAYVQYDTSTALPVNKFVREGYSFAEWNTEQDGSGQPFTNGGNVLKLTPVNNATVILYAQWTPNSTEITFNANGGEGNMGAFTITSDEANATLPDNTFARMGYTFVGWGESATTTIVKYADKAVIPKNEILNITKDKTQLTLYALWTQQTYRVIFNPNATSASGTMTDQVIGYDLSATLRANGFSYPGYKFTGWNTRADGTGTAYTDAAQVRNITTEESITLYAQWEKLVIPVQNVTINVTWDDNQNQDGLRPSSLSFTLAGQANGASVSSTSVDMSSSESTKTISDVPMQFLGQSGLSPINYSLSLKNAVQGYTYSVQSSGSGYSVTFKHTPSTTKVPVKVVFNDVVNQDGLRPSTVQITLRGSNGSTYSATITITADTTNYIFDNLPMYANGQKISYSMATTNIPNYQVSANGTTMTASYTPKTTNITISAKWNDDNDSGKTRPDSLAVTLTGSNGKSYKETLKKTSNYTATVLKVPEYSRGSKITYSVAAGVIDKYNANISGDASAGFTITMVLTNKARQSIAAIQGAQEEDAALRNKNIETVQDTKKKSKIKTSDINVSVIWNDGDKAETRPSTFAIALKGSDGQVHPKELTRASSYKYTFSKIPIDDESGEPVNFIIQYEKIDGYTTHVYKDRQNPYNFIIENFAPEKGSYYLRSDYEAAGGESADRSEIIKIPNTMDDADIELINSGLDTDDKWDNPRVEDEPGFFETLTNTFGEDNKTLFIIIGILALLTIVGGSIYLIKSVQKR